MNEVQQLLKEAMILSIKRGLRPNLEDNKRTWEIMDRLYELTKEEIYKM